MASDQTAMAFLEKTMAASDLWVILWLFNIAMENHHF
jgi:hypothetical protein